MMFWIIASLICLLVSFYVMLPLIRKSSIVIDDLAHDKAVYQSRLEEIEKDIQLGRLSAEQGEAAKAEEGRKLIALSKTGSEQAPEKKVGADISQNKLRFLTLIMFVATPLAALAIYLPVGNPQMPDQSLTSRLNTNPTTDQSVEELLVKAEAHLAKSPDDARGWSVVAPVYTRLGRRTEAVKAWANVLRLSPDHPNVRSLLGEAILATTDGVMNDRAFALFEEELKRDQSSARARYYIAIGLGQSGKNREAAEAWQTLLDGTDSAAPWRQSAIEFRNQQRELAGLPKLSSTTSQPAPNIPGPTQEQIEAAQEMSAEDRNAMIASMVEGLAEKLKDDPTDKEGWKRLVQAYRVLDKNEEAATAIEKAVSSNADDTDFVAYFNQIKEQLNKAN